jgi:hypothetical protein
MRLDLYQAETAGIAHEMTALLDTARTRINIPTSTAPLRRKRGRGWGRVAE